MSWLLNGNGVSKRDKVQEDDGFVLVVKAVEKDSRIYLVSKGTMLVS